MAMRLLIFSEYQVQKTNWMRNRTYAGMVSRLVSKVSKPSDLKLRVKYLESVWLELAYY